MPKAKLVGHKRLINVLVKSGFKVVREGKHTIMYKDKIFVSIPRHTPLKRFTLEGIIKDAGLTIDEFNRLV